MSAIAIWTPNKNRDLGSLARSLSLLGESFNWYVCDDSIGKPRAKCESLAARGIITCLSPSYGRRRPSQIFDWFFENSNELDVLYCESDYVFVKPNFITTAGAILSFPVGQVAAEYAPLVRGKRKSGLLDENERKGLIETVSYVILNQRTYRLTRSRSRRAVFGGWLMRCHLTTRQVLEKILVDGLDEWPQVEVRVDARFREHGFLTAFIVPRPGEPPNYAEEQPRGIRTWAT